jgi:hypothetical protein
MLKRQISMPLLHSVNASFKFSSFTHRLRRTPLHYCAFHNNVDAVQALLNARADINAKST